MFTTLNRIFTSLFKKMTALEKHLIRMEKNRCDRKSDAKTDKKGMNASRGWIRIMKSFLNLPLLSYS
jgi:hypothetical protein